MFEMVMARVSARKVQELAQIGERDPKRLCMGAVKCFQA
jgi:hypothetical protein